MNCIWPIGESENWTFVTHNHRTVQCLLWSIRILFEQRFKFIPLATLLWFVFIRFFSYLWSQFFFFYFHSFISGLRRRRSTQSPRSKSWRTVHGEMKLTKDRIGFQKSKPKKDLQLRRGLLKSQNGTAYIWYINEF